MDIKYFGHSSFKLSNNQVTVVTDPFDPSMVGLKFAKTDADAVTVSHQHGDHNKIDLVDGDPLVIDISGEFEKKGARITGYPCFHDDKNGAERGRNIIFKIEIDDVTIVHCGDLGHKLSNELVEELGDVDVLLIPVGGFYTISAEEAVAVVKLIEPHVVIPMHYAVEGINSELKEKLAPVSKFMSSMGGQTVEPIAKFTVKKGELENDNMRIVILE